MYEFSIFNVPPAIRQKKILVWALILPLLFFSCKNANTPGGGDSGFFGQGTVAGESGSGNGGGSGGSSEQGTVPDSGNAGGNSGSSTEQDTVTGVDESGGGDNGSPAPKRGVVTEGGWTGGVTVTDEDGLIKSITLENGRDYLIGRKNTEQVELNINEKGELQLRAPDTDGYIPIGSYAEFQLINKKGLGSANKKKKYRQIADIDLMDLEWDSIGHLQNVTYTSFYGTYDGNGKKLDNLKVTSKSDYTGLFGFLEQGGVLMNICINSGSVTGKDNTGGITGSNNGTVIACVNRGSVTGEQNTGGIAGSSIGTITACYNTGLVSGNTAVGGITGYAIGTVAACYNTGLTFGKGRNGALVGYNKSSGIIESYWQAGTVANGIGHEDAYIANNINKFSELAWPVGSGEWGIGDGSGSGRHWKNLGSWNSGSPQYPVLWWE